MRLSKVQEDTIKSWAKHMSFEEVEKKVMFYNALIDKYQREEGLPEFYLYELGYENSNPSQEVEGLKRSRFVMEQVLEMKNKMKQV